MSDRKDVIGPPGHSLLPFQMYIELSFNLQGTGRHKRQVLLPVLLHWEHLCIAKKALFYSSKTTHFFLAFAKLPQSIGK